MFTIDERLKGLPALKEQVMSLHESLNQPHLAVPGRTAGPAKAYILGLRGPSGFAVFVYLWLPQSSECAVYVPSNRAASAEQFEGEEIEALSFVESMGFIMDNLGFRTRSNTEQDQMMKSIPLFQKDPTSMAPRPSIGTGPKPAAPPPDRGAPQAGPSVSAIGKLLGSFVWLLWAASCAHVPTEKEQREAQAYYDLAVNLAQKEPQAALVELERALSLDPDLPEAHNAKGVLMHTAFSRPEEAIASYQQALKLRPTFSEAKVNLGNVYLDQKRFDDAAVLYREALNDMLYPTPFLAQGNLGWAQYKKGSVDEALQSIKSALTLNPKFCLGYRNLGTIYDERGATDEACKAFGKFREACPDVADAYQREGVCLAKKGDLAGAHRSLQGCMEKARAEAQRDDCKRLKESLGPAPAPAPEAGGN